MSGGTIEILTAEEAGIISGRVKDAHIASNDPIFKEAIEAINKACSEGKARVNVKFDSKLSVDDTKYLLAKYGYKCQQYYINSIDIEWKIL